MFLKNPPFFIPTKSALFLFDMQGRISDSQLSPEAISDPDVFLSVQRLMARGANIRKFFEIPGTFDFRQAQSFDKEAPFSPAFTNQSPAFRWFYEEQGFFSKIPLFTLHVRRFDRGHCIGIVRSTGFFQNVHPENTLHGYVSVDSRERLAAFNSLFYSFIGNTSHHPFSLLGRELKEFLAPPPSAVQEEEERALVLPGAGAFTTVHADEWEKGRVFAAPPDTPLFSVLPLTVDWDRKDIKLEFELMEGVPPCLVIGDVRRGSGDMSDLEGYLLGPHPDLSGMILKKRASLHSNTFLPPGSMGPGQYSFFCLGNRFVAEHEGRRLLFFSDSDPIQRGAVRVALMVRAGLSLRLRRVRLSTKPLDAGRTARNAFVALTARPGSFYLFSLVRHHLGGGGQDSYSTYRMQNLSDVKEKFQRLEAGYREAAERMRDADLKLKEYLDGHDLLVGVSRTLALIREQADKAAPSRVTILIQGATGTGKEVLAKHIHLLSPFAKGPFVKVDCATLPQTLMESLFFGHEKGAFTGALGRRKGLFEQAENGTLFLDEVHNLGLPVQAKLLQFLQDTMITPVGGSRPIRLNLRVIVASNQPLEELTARGLFREDLYYRIAVVMLRLPPLCERMEDLPALAEHFIRTFNLKYGRDVRGLAPAALRKLFNHAWPGNVRELKNTLERAFLFGASDEILEQDIAFGRPEDRRPASPAVPGIRKPLVRIARPPETVVELFRKQKGIAKRVADELGVTRQTLYNFIRQHGLGEVLLRRPRADNAGKGF
jgi:DNA-binding NtrC family response regulator